MADASSGRDASAEAVPPSPDEDDPAPREVPSGPAASWDSAGEKAGEVLNVRAEATRHETVVGRIINRVGDVLSHPACFLTLLGAHAAWVGLNVPGWPWAPWDPYPFTFLATVMSAMSPFIALLILMRQQHDRRVSELREETTLQVLLYVEREMTASLRLAGQQRSRPSGPPPDEDALRQLQEDLDPEDLMEHLRQRLDRIEGNGAAEEEPEAN